MKSLILITVLAAILAGCANTETQRCRKINRVTYCEDERREPREPHTRADRP